MKKQALLYASAILIFIITTSEILSSNGKAGYTGSPNESTCITCHSGSPLNSGGGSITITTNIPNDQYAPNITYQITVTVSQNNVSLFGFGCEALTATNNNGGTLIITDAGSTTLKTVLKNGVNRNNVVHTVLGGANTNSKAFTFNWKAPSNNVGNITFYAAGNAANSNNASSGDFIYSTSKIITPDPATGIAEETIETGLSVFPNPIKNTFSVKLSSEAGHESSPKFNLFNLNGAIVKELNIQNTSFEVKNYSFNRDDIASGIYLLQVIDGTKMKYSKVVVE